MEESEDNDKITNYLSLSNLYLKNADGMIKKKEYSKAGEMLWGGIAELLKAIGIVYGRPISKHKELIKIAKYISLMENDDNLRDAIVRYAHSLHANYYENFIEPEEFGEYYAIVVKAHSRLLEIIMRGYST